MKNKDGFESDNQVFNDIDQIEEIEQRRKRALTSLLDNKLNIKGKILAQKINMGIYQSQTGSNKLVPSYSTVQTIGYVADTIKMGSDMPFMKDKIDEKTQKLIIDKENFQAVMQRAPDWSRQIALTTYLIANKNHKFTSILAVIEPSWVNDPKHDNWGDDGRAIKSSIEFEALDSAGKVGLINIENAITYALDGQHRIMGFKGIRELLGGMIFELTKNGKQKGDAITREKFLEKFGVDSSILGKIMDETVSIEYVPAVISGETREEARRRLRSYFVYINTYAKKVSKGEASLLDEEDGYKIIGKDLALDHPLFPPDKSRINFQDQSIPKTSNWLTTLEAITNMSERFLSQSDEKRGARWTPIYRGSLKIRPSDEDLSQAREEFKGFLDGMHSLPVFQRLDRGESIQKLREFGSDTDDGLENEGHLLTRPIGQQILADAVGRLIKKGGNLKTIFKVVKKIDESGQFSAHKTSSMFYGITVDLLGKKMLKDNQSLAAELLEYLINGAHTDQQSKLIEAIVEKRTIATDTSKWINFTGKTVSKESATINDLPKPHNLT